MSCFPKTPVAPGSTARGDPSYRFFVHEDVLDGTETAAYFFDYTEQVVGLYGSAYRSNTHQNTSGNKSDIGYRTFDPFIPFASGSGVGLAVVGSDNGSGVELYVKTTNEQDANGRSRFDAPSVKTAFNHFLNGQFRYGAGTQLLSGGPNTRPSWLRAHTDTLIGSGSANNPDAPIGGTNFFQENGSFAAFMVFSRLATGTTSLFSCESYLTGSSSYREFFGVYLDASGNVIYKHTDGSTAGSVAGEPFLKFNTGFPVGDVCYLMVIRDTVRNKVIVYGMTETQLKARLPNGMRYGVATPGYTDSLGNTVVPHPEYNNYTGAPVTSQRIWQPGVNWTPDFVQEQSYANNVVGGTDCVFRIGHNASQGLEFSPAQGNQVIPSRVAVNHFRFWDSKSIQLYQSPAGTIYNPNNGGTPDGDLWEIYRRAVDPWPWHEIISHTGLKFMDAINSKGTLEIGVSLWYANSSGYPTSQVVPSMDADGTFAPANTPAPSTLATYDPTNPDGNQQLLHRLMTPNRPYLILPTRAFCSRNADASTFEDSPRAYRHIRYDDIYANPWDVVQCGWISAAESDNRLRKRYDHIPPGPGTQLFICGWKLTGIDLKGLLQRVKITESFYTPQYEDQAWQMWGLANMQFWGSRSDGNIHMICNQQAKQKPIAFGPDPDCLVQYQHAGQELAQGRMSFSNTDGLSAAASIAMVGHNVSITAADETSKGITTVPNPYRDPSFVANQNCCSRNYIDYIYCRPDPFYRPWVGIVQHTFGYDPTRPVSESRQLVPRLRGEYNAHYVPIMGPDDEFYQALNTHTALGLQGAAVSGTSNSGFTATPSIGWASYGTTVAFLGQDVTDYVFNKESKRLMTELVVRYTQRGGGGFFDTAATTSRISTGPYADRESATGAGIHRAVMTAAWIAKGDVISADLTIGQFAANPDSNRGPFWLADTMRETLVHTYAGRRRADLRKLLRRKPNVILSSDYLQQKAGIYTTQLRYKRAAVGLGSGTTAGVPLPRLNARPGEVMTVINKRGEVDNCDIVNSYTYDSSSQTTYYTLGFPPMPDGVEFDKSEMQSLAGVRRGILTPDVN